MNMRNVSSDESDRFIAEYPRRLVRDVTQITEPDTVRFYDDSLIVATHYAYSNYDGSGPPKDFYVREIG